MRKLLYLPLILIFLIGCSSQKLQQLKWRSEGTGTKADIAKVCFVDAKHGWAATGDGQVLATLDGGQTWKATKLGTAPLTSVWFVNQKDGWAVGAQGGLYQTSDGGASFSNRSQNPAYDFFEVVFWDKRTGIVAGKTLGRDSLVRGLVLRTEDGGKNWSEVYSDFDSLTAAFVLPPGFGWLGADGNIWTTKDGGANWEKSYLGTGITINDLYLDIYSSGYLVGDNGTFYRSYDRGWSWKSQGGQFPKRKLHAVDFTDRFRGVVVGDSGTILLTSDGGDSWSLDDSFTKADLYDIFVLGNKLWLCGSGGTIISVR